MVERVLGSSARSIDMVLTDHFQYGGIVFDRNGQRDLTDVIFEDILEQKVEESEYIKSYAEELKLQAAQAHENKLIKEVFKL